MRMLTPNLSINVAAKVESMIYWKINDKAKEPYRATPMSAGVDVYALNPDLIVPNTIKVVPTGIGCQMPSNHYGQLSTRSSLAQRGVIVVGGVIDPDYHGEIKVILMNVGLNPFVVSQGDRIAQLLIIPIHIEPIREGEAPSELKGTCRGVSPSPTKTILFWHHIKLNISPFYFFQKRCIYFARHPFMFLSICK